MESKRLLLITAICVFVFSVVVSAKQSSRRNKNKDIIARSSNESDFTLSTPSLLSDNFDAKLSEDSLANKNVPLQSLNESTKTSDTKNRASHRIGNHHHHRKLKSHNKRARGRGSHNKKRRHPVADKAPATESDVVTSGSNKSMEASGSPDTLLNAPIRRSRTGRRKSKRHHHHHHSHHRKRNIIVEQQLAGEKEN